MYGWLGSKPKHVEKYANLYTDRGCTVVYDIASPMELMAKFDRPLDTIALRTVKKACELIRTVENGGCKVPVILHYFSNGGAFIVERLGFLIRAVQSSQNKIEQSPSSPVSASKESPLASSTTVEVKPKYVDEFAVKDLLFLSERLKDMGYEIADSAPAYLSKQASFNAIESSVENQGVRALFKSILSLFIYYHILLDKCMNRDQGDVRFWTNMIKNDLCSCQAFIYSHADKITDPVKVDEFIEERVKRGVHVVSMKFDYSDHVLHMRKYPNEYKKFIDEILQEVFKKENE